MNLISYGWTGDAHTVYETRTVIAASAGVVAQAKVLAQAGYTISAFGGNDANGYLLVGTRVQGDTAPRTLVITTPTLDHRDNLCHHDEQCHAEFLQHAGGSFCDCYIEPDSDQRILKLGRRGWCCS